MEDKKVWNMLRIGFWSMIGLVIIMYLPFIYLLNIIAYLAYFFIACGSVIFTFVMSIIHLKQYKQKAFAITSLIISSIFLSFGFLFFMIGVLQGIMELG